MTLLKPYDNLFFVVVGWDGDGVVVMHVVVIHVVVIHTVALSCELLRLLLSWFSQYSSILHSAYLV